MKEQDTIRTTIENLESLFSIMNDEFYNSELETPIITVAPDERHRCYGWCTTWKAWNIVGEHERPGYYEINVCSDYLHRPMMDTAETMLHEMAHLYNLKHEIKDCSRAGTYHNKKYKETAEAHGLTVSQSQKNGYAITELNKEATAFLQAVTNIKFEIVRYNGHQAPDNKNDKSDNGQTEGGEDDKKKKKSSTRRYQCPTCGTIIRATKDVNVICADCMELMIKLDD